MAIAGNGILAINGSRIIQAPTERQMFDAVVSKEIAQTESSTCICLSCNALRRFWCHGFACTITRFRNPQMFIFSHFENKCGVQQESKYYGFQNV